MIFAQPLSFINEFVEELDRWIRQCAPNRKLSTVQRYWLSFCLMGILLANPACWAAFERVGLGLFWVVHNFIRKHFTTQQVPAVALGLLKQGLSWGRISRIQMQLTPSI